MGAAITPPRLGARHSRRAAAAAVIGMATLLVPMLPAGAQQASERAPGWVDGRAPRYPHRHEMNERFRDRIAKVQQQILERNRNGEDLPCSSQILEEASWLVNYTDRRADAEERVDALEASLKQSGEAQQWVRRPDPQDGSYGGCYREWFLRLQATVDPMTQLLQAGGRPRYPLRILEPVDSPEKIVAYFERLVISQPEVDGVDRRKELNFAVTALGQLLFEPKLAGALPDDWPREQVAAALIRFMDERWQDPETGYWGAWYKVEDRIVKTEDLSITFHIASYRGGRINDLPKLVRTTYLNRTRPYPYGWQDRGSQNCHHAYDVVRLLRFGWPHMTELERANAQAQIMIILARALRFAVTPDGQFDATPYKRMAEAYYFGVSLLDEVGYFRSSQNFWSTVDFAPDNEVLREKILSQLDRSLENDPMIQAARAKLLARD